MEIKIHRGQDQIGGNIIIATSTLRVSEAPPGVFVREA